MNTVSKMFNAPSATRLETLLKEVVLAYNDHRQAILDRYNVTELEVEIIRYLDAQEQKKMKEVGEHFGIKLSTLTSTIDKLEKNKLVKRKNSREDRRVIYIKPTAKGQTLLSDLIETTRSLSLEMEKENKAPDFEIIVSGLDRILTHLKTA
ncbi:MAG: MarR family transcriptional regulator [Bacteroidota bacterium]